MKKSLLSIIAVLLVWSVTAFPCGAQILNQARFRHTDYHSGVHSGSWTLKRSQILEEESKDHHRSCKSPHCNRCSKHLADYGHEYQYITGPSQRQIWYRGTAGSIAPVTQRCYDEHGAPYHFRGRPGAVMSWEYQHYLNHCIKDQVRAHNAVAAEENAEERLGLLTHWHEVALARYAESCENWEAIKETGCCISQVKGLLSPCMKALGAQEMDGHLVLPEQMQEISEIAICEYCAAKAQYLKDKNYLAAMQRELELATADWQRKTAYADERVRIALLSKEDADKATRFKRIQHKPPKYKEVLAAQEAAQARYGKNVTDTENNENEESNENNSSE